MLKNFNSLIVETTHTNECVMRSKIKITTFFLALFLNSEILLSQMISSAIMDVQVEVISGSRIDMNHGYYSVNSKQSDSLENFEMEYGNFTISVPEGSEIIVESNSEIKMSDRSSSWTMNSEHTHSILDDYSLQILFTGTPGDNHVMKGHYSGKQVATIQYL